MGTEFTTGLAASDDGHTAGRKAAEQAVADLDASAVDFCQVFSPAVYDHGAVLDGIRSVIGPDATLLGCSSGGSFTESGLDPEGVALALVAGDNFRADTALGTGLAENPTGCVRETKHALADRGGSHPPNHSLLALHDALAGVGEQLALISQRKFEGDVQLAGGSASDHMAMASTPVFVEDEVVDDALAIARLSTAEPVVVSVNHGHHPISDPLEVTAAEDNVVSELDGRPAFEVWSEVVRPHASETFDVGPDEVDPGSPDLSRLFGQYEFGIDQGQTYKIRWPGMTQRKDGPITFPVAIPEGTVLRIMHSPPEDQVESVVEAAENALAAAGDRELAGAFVYDCICRSNILGDQFSDAVNALAATLDLPMIGFKTYGELCMERGRMSGYHNTTSVIMLLPS